MLYFSELKNKSVVNQQGEYIGRLDDLVFKSSPTAPVSKLLVQTPARTKLMIPMTAVTKINAVIRVQNDILPVKLEENELFVGKNVSDQQVIDITGSKMVRVNDVVFIQQPQLHISGVDVGLLGIVRWFGLEDDVCRLARYLYHPLTPRFLSWGDVAPLELARGRVMMRKQETNLKRLNPEDLADHLDRTNIRNVRRIVSLLDETYAAEVINNLNVSFQTALFKSFTPERAAKVVALLDQDEAVDILLTLERHQRTRIIQLLVPEKQEAVTSLMKLSRTPIGDIVTLEYYEVMADQTVRSVREMVQRNPDLSVHSANIFVVNHQKQLVGVFNLFELLVQTDDTPIYKFMIQNVVVIHLSTPKEIAFKKMLKYRLGALPVIDNDKTLIGVIRWHNAYIEK